MRILVLGGYGLIGLAVVRRLHRMGHEVVGLGRSRYTGEKACPDVSWIEADISRHTDSSAWNAHLADVDAVINASGALQDGAKDNLDLSQSKAMVALIDCAQKMKVKRFIQISAPGAEPDASTAFMRTKAAADDRLRRSDLAWTILKPGLVIGAQAYGGTALIRMLAGFPVVLPLVFANSRVQTVGLDDVVDCVVAALDGDIPAGTDLDLVEPDAHTLRQVVESFRRWLGFPEAVAVVRVPHWLGAIVAGCADMLGRLGWRSPLRTTALQVISEDVLGDPQPLRTHLRRDLAGLGATLAALPATLQERWFARLYLAMPVMVSTLSLFWIVSGLFGVLALDAAAAVLPETVPTTMAFIFVIGGAIADIALGAAILYRPWAKWACYGMIALTVVYLLAGTVLTPLLWLDPLGPFVKTIPAAVLAWVTTLVLEDR